MKQLFAHEMKKIFSNRLFLFLLLFLLFVDGLYIYKTYDTYRDPYNKETSEAQWKIYQTVEGEITAEKVNALTAMIDRLEADNTGDAADLDPSMAAGADGGAQSGYYYNAYWDLTVARNLFDKLSAAYYYSRDMEALLAENEALLALYREKGNTTLVKQAELIAESYSGRAITSYYDTETYGSYFSYDFSSFLILLLVFLMTAALYAGETESGMRYLLRSTPGGRLRLMAAKQCAMAVSVTAICVLFFVCDFLLFLWCVRLRGGGNPLYSITAFSQTPLNLTVGGFALLLAALKWIGFLCFGQIGCLLSSLFEKSFLVFAADLLLCFALMVLSTCSGGILEYLNLLNPLQLLIGREMFYTFRTVELFGAPVFRYGVCLGCCVALGMVLFAATAALNNAGMKRRRRRA